MEIKGIDVSAYQGKPNWAYVKQGGIQVAILRVTDAYGIDASFEHNYKGCVDNGIKVGVYKFSYALTPAEAVKEADEVLAVLAGRKLDYPVWYDIEWEKQYPLGKTAVANIIKAFLDRIKEKSSYEVGVYSNTNWYNNYFDHSIVPTDNYWMASVPVQTNDNGTIKEYLRPSIGCAWQYSWKGVVPGIIGDVDMDVFYKDFTSTVASKVESVTSKYDRNKVVDIMRKWLGKNEADGSHKMIVDIYNSIRPLPIGYMVTYYDAWCAATVSAAYHQAGYDAIFPSECGCDRMIQLAKNKGIWVEDDAYVPSPGDCVLYDWQDSGYGDNVGGADHIGMVESVDNGVITVIEGNCDCAVKRRYLNVNGRYIRGFITPKFTEAYVDAPEQPVIDSKRKSVDELAREVLDGVWGNGDARKDALIEAGYDYTAVQAKVNELVVKKAMKSIDTIADEVLKGKWGNGAARKEALEKAGYDYLSVQSKVNEILRKR